MSVRFYGLGELPGTSISNAADVVAGETGDLRQLPILPARGIDPIGLTAGMLPGMHVDVGPRSWVLTTRPQLRTRRVWDRLEADLDQCEQVWGTRVDAVKVQVAGPWSLAASLELSNGHRAITDRGALRDITEALIAGTRDYVADVARRFDTQVYVQLDEPLLARLHAGKIPGTSDFDTLAAIGSADLGERLALVVEGTGAEFLNQTGYPPLWQVAQVSGMPTVQVSLDLVVGTAQLDGIGQAAASGVRIGLGVTGPGEERHPRDIAVQIAGFWDELGLDRTLLSTSVDVHPRSGLGNCSLGEAAAALKAAGVVAGMLERDAGDL